MQGLLAQLRAAGEQTGDTERSAGRTDEGPLIDKPVFGSLVRQPQGDEQETRDAGSDASTVCGDDASDEIDIVMATNRTGRSRGRGASSTPRDNFKNSRARGSRVSLNSVATSEVSLVDVAESDEENTRRTRRLSPMQAWAAFEDTVKNIDNSNPYTFMKKPKPNFIASNTFQQVMVDMYGNTEYGNTKGYTLLKQKLNNMAKASTLASRMFISATQKGMEDQVVGTEREPQTAEPEPEEPLHSVGKMFAKRGWKMLKRQVNETVMEQKTQSGKLNWTMLQHTLKQMTNVEKTRQDLYERYGIVPTVQEDGTVTCENRMLSERARAQLYGRNKDGAPGDVRRPNSYQPPPTHLRSHSQASSYHSKGQISNSKGKGKRLPKPGKPRQRPVTAVR